VDAEDISQEVFLQIHRSIRSYQGRASLSTWIFGIAHNVTCRHFRARSAETVSLESAIGSERMTTRPRAERRMDASRAVEKCTRTLTRNRNPEHFEIFRLFYGCGRPLRAISSATGRSTETVKDSLRRSRNLLLREVPDIRAALAATSACA
jgi:RNA polymerase sigma factor (sigma-70 family)